ncbi:MAG TPA: aspartyl-phosphate phosphatase Spo0E family protein [Syntrophomonadaceae bacterium]|nr:aspartyl-phosphate phosphatase Spo0E family protein [Syntrophomonadaceae bacterium]
MKLLILHLKIEAMRKRLIHLAEKYGRSHPLVLAASRRLDGLVVEYMRMVG